VNVVALSPRQRRALELVGKGLSLAEAAVEMGISVKTIPVHLAAARKRLGAKNTREAYRIFLELTEAAAVKR
jgi:DNA-binding CsgD family transcriptional regulator